MRCGSSITHKGQREPGIHFRDLEQLYTNNHLKTQWVPALAFWLGWNDEKNKKMALKFERAASRLAEMLV